MLSLGRTVVLSVVLSLAAAALAFFLMGSASAKQSAGAIARLRFMAGSWRCVVRGGVSSSEAFDLTSTRDDNGATVSIHPKNDDSFDWVIESANHAYIVTEICRRWRK